MGIQGYLRPKDARLFRGRNLFTTPAEFEHILLFVEDVHSVATFCEHHKLFPKCDKIDAGLDLFEGLNSFSIVTSCDFGLQVMWPKGAG